MTKGKLADVKFDPCHIGQEIGHAPGSFREPLGQDWITLVVVPAQDILGVEFRTVGDLQLALPAAAGGADALGGESSPASRFVSLLQQEHPRALFRRHESSHETAPSGTDDEDIAVDRIQLRHRTSKQLGHNI